MFLFIFILSKNNKNAAGVKVVPSRPTGQLVLLREHVWCWRMRTSDQGGGTRNTFFVDPWSGEDDTIVHAAHGNNYTGSAGS